MTQVKIKGNETHQCYVPPDLIHWEEHSTSQVLAKPESNHRQSDKPNLRDSPIGQYSAKVLDRERKERGREGKGRKKKTKRR